MDTTTATHFFRSDDKGGTIFVRNLSAFWLPELTLEREIGGAVYTVSGSYEGTETLDRKLDRVLTQNLDWEAEKE